jgi:hypothetical protein
VSRIGLNVGALTLDDGPQGELPRDAVRGFAALGYSHRLSDRFWLNAGAGYARNLGYERDAVARPNEAGAQSEIAVGSIMTDGIWTLPLVEYRASDSLSLGVSARASYLPEERSASYEVTVGWVWTFGHLDMEKQ